MPLFSIQAREGIAFPRLDGKSHPFYLKLEGQEYKNTYHTLSCRLRARIHTPAHRVQDGAGILTRSLIMVY